MSEHLRALTATIVSAHVANNPVHPHLLPGLIKTVFQTLATVDAASGPDRDRGSDRDGLSGRPAGTEPAVPIAKSVFPDYIVCLEDGARMKMLKRRLATTFHMTPHQYRQKWGLPDDYPMVAPNYAQLRSALAKGFGLGRQTGAKRSDAAARVVHKPLLRSATK